MAPDPNDLGMPQAPSDLGMAPDPRDPLAADGPLASWTALNLVEADWAAQALRMIRGLLRGLAPPAE